MGFILFTTDEVEQWVEKEFGPPPDPGCLLQLQPWPEAGSYGELALFMHGPFLVDRTMAGLMHTTYFATYFRDQFLAHVKLWQIWDLLSRQKMLPMETMDDMIYGRWYQDITEHEDCLPAGLGDFVEKLIDMREKAKAD